MFDKLVESTKQKPQGRNKFYLATSLIYGTALSIVAVMTVIWFNPAMAEATTAMMLLTPPPIPAAPAPVEPMPTRPAPVPQFIPPTIPPKVIPNPREVPPAPAVRRTTTIIPGAEMFRDAGGTGVPSSIGITDGKDAPPPPPPTPVPTPKATPTPEPAPKTPEIVRMTSSMITGKAVRKVQPPYPPMGKAVKAQGSVPIQITISEEGRVISAQAVSGHPLLQQAAREAAMQWVFSPTLLNGKPVKVSGVISFNFILN